MALAVAAAAAAPVFVGLRRAWRAMIAVRAGARFSRWVRWAASSRACGPTAGSASGPGPAAAATWLPRVAAESDTATERPIRSRLRRRIRGILHGAHATSNQLHCHARISTVQRAIAPMRYAESGSAVPAERIHDDVGGALKVVDRHPSVGARLHDHQVGHRISRHPVEVGGGWRRVGVA